MGYYEGDLCLSNGNSNNGWGDWSWIIGLALVGGLFGNGGFGFGGGYGGGREGFYGYPYASPATVQDVASGFSTSEIMSDLNDIILGQAQGFANVQQTLCQGFSGVNATVTNGFANLNTNLASFAYNTQTGFNGLSREIADFSCATQRAIDGVKYENAKNTCDIIRAGQDNTRAILDYLTGEKISALQAENSGLKAQISNDRQSAYLLNELKPCPIPAYITCNPNAPYGLGYGVGFGFSTNTGCCGASVQ